MVLTLYSSTDGTVIQGANSENFKLVFLTKNSPEFEGNLY